MTDKLPDGLFESNNKWTDRSIKDFTAGDWVFWGEITLALLVVALIIFLAL